MAREFIDTNILVYAFSEDPRSAVAETLFSSGCDTGVQVLNEFANVARRKLSMNWAEIREALGAIRALCRTIHPLDVETHERAIELAAEDGFSLFDALIVAAALQSGCGVLHSEDMQHGRIVAGRLRINNPFRA